MKKIAAFLWIFIVIVWVSLWILLFIERDFVSNFRDWTEISSFSWTEVIDVIHTKPTSEDVQQKILTLRKRYSLKWVLLEGDLYSQEREYELALERYLDAYSQNPSDQVIINKIADTYYDMQKFEKAYLYYKKIKNYPSVDKQKIIISLLNYRPIISENLEYMYSELESLPLSTDEKYFYTTALQCVNDFHVCKKSFWEYISNNQEISFEWISDIDKAIKQYQAFQLEQIYYKNTLILWVFFRYSMYELSIALWKQILLEKKSYKPVLQIIAKSYFEIGNYKQAKKFLAQYYELQQDDIDAIYLLWVINQKLGEYLISNIFLKKALKWGYADSLNIRRRMIFNYYYLENNERMLEVFKDIINENEDEVNENDILLSVYYHIIKKQYDYAFNLCLIAIEKYSENDNLYAYLWLIELERWNYEESEKYLMQWNEINGKNPIVNLYLGQLQEKKWNIKKAFIYYKKTKSQDKNWEWWKKADELLENIELGQKEEKMKSE